MIVWRAYVHAVVVCGHPGCFEEVSQTRHDMFFDNEPDALEEAEARGWEPELPPDRITNIHERDEWFERRDLRWYCPAHAPKRRNILWKIERDWVIYLPPSGDWISEPKRPPLRAPSTTKKAYEGPCQVCSQKPPSGEHMVLLGQPSGRWVCMSCYPTEVAKIAPSAAEWEEFEEWKAKMEGKG